MIPGIFSAQAMGSSEPGPGSRFIGASYSIDASSNNMTLPVPAGAEVGDTLILCAIVRLDRSASPPPGFASLYSDQFGIGNQGARIYVWAKAYASEASVTAVHSVSAAYGAALICVRGQVVQHQHAVMASSGVSVSITAAAASTLVSFSGYQPISTSNGEVPAGSNEGWATDGETLYLTTSELINYLGYVYHRPSVGGAHSCGPGISPGSVANRVGYAWVAEIGP